MKKTEFWIWWCLIWMVSVGVLSGQPRGRVAPNMMSPDQLNPAEGAEVLAAFRASGIASDASFIFQLRHLPRRGDAVTYTGQLWSAQLETGLAHRVWVHPLRNEDPHWEWLLFSGREPMAIVRDPVAAVPILLNAHNLVESLVPGLAITPFDLQMAFVFWEDHIYEGTRRVRGRPAHFFLLYPPAGSADLEEHVGAVRITVDAGFNALLGVEVLSPTGEVLRSWSVQNFRRVHDQWIVRIIDMIDNTTRDRTRFEIKAAAVWLQLPESIFDPDTLGDPPVVPATQRFNWF